MMKEYKNVVLLSVDALRKDRVNGKYGRDVAPYLTKLAKENTEFLNCMSTSSHTREAMSGMLTGKYPYKANKTGIMPKSAPGGGFHLDTDTISSYIDELSTAGFHSNPFLSRSYGYDDNWDKFDDSLYLGNNKAITLLKRFLDKLRDKHYVRADEINEKSLNWVKSQEDGFFLWNHYMDPHGPYQPPKEVRGKYQHKVMADRESQKLLKKAINTPEEISENEKSKLIDLYDEELTYTDQQVKEFIESLEDEGILNETLVIIVGDHGEAFGENGFYEHGEALNEELVRVPLILVNGKDRSVDTPVSILDIVPTILSNFQKIDNEFDGENLNDIIKSEEDFKDRTVYFQDTKDHKLLFGGFNLQEGFFVFEKGEDEPTDSGIENQVLNYSKSALDREDSDEDGGEVEEEVKERLEALGYMEEKSR